MADTVAKFSLKSGDVLTLNGSFAEDVPLSIANLLAKDCPETWIAAWPALVCKVGLSFVLFNASISFTQNRAKRVPK